MIRKVSLNKSSAGTKKTLILGIGNTIRGDDAVGILAVRALAKCLDSSLKKGVDIKELEESGINLLELLSGYKKAVLVDSITTRTSRPGRIHRLSKISFLHKIADYSTHQFGIPAILKIAQDLKLRIPKYLKLYAIEIEPKDDYSTTVTPVAQEAAERLVKLLKKEVE